MRRVHVCGAHTSVPSFTAVPSFPAAQVTNKYRTLKGFSDSGYSKMQLEPYFMLYKQYYGSTDTYAHDLVEGAYQSSGDFAGLDDEGRYSVMITAAGYMNVSVIVVECTRARHVCAWLALCRVCVSWCARAVGACVCFLSGLTEYCQRHTRSCTRTH